MEKKLNVFLDLEETVIKDWFEPFELTMNVMFVKEQVEVLKKRFGQNVSFHVFSFAVSDERDLEVFNEELRPWLESEFGEVESCFMASNENLFDLAAKKGLARSDMDMPSDLFGNMKSEAFEEFVKLNHKNEVNVLFDDVVENSEKTFFNGEMFDHENSTKVIMFKV